MTNRICIIGTYFGKVKPYFDLWLKSAAFNQSIDFLIVSDQNLKITASNVKELPMSLKAFKQLAEKKLAMSISLERPYKMCDFKPAYGLILEDHLSQYDYWGHCDFDLIWGDLQSYFDQYHLYDYDKFLPLGHLSLYRNTKENNRRFMLSGSIVGDYKKVFTTPGNLAFDEIDGMLKIFENNGFTTFKERIFADISIHHHRFTLAQINNNFKQQVFYYKDGHVYRAYEDGIIKNDEFLYIHFKQRGDMKVYGDCINNNFFITNSGFYPLEKDKVDQSDIQQYNAYPGDCFEQKELRKVKRFKFYRRVELKLCSILHIEPKQREK